MSQKERNLWLFISDLQSNEPSSLEPEKAVFDHFCVHLKQNHTLIVRGINLKSIFLLRLLNMSKS